MLKKLQKRWKVNSLNLVLIIATFAIGGSLCGWAARKLLLVTGLEKGIPWILVYIVVVTLLWPVCVILVSFPMGQFRFFKNYIIKVWSKMSGKSVPVANQGARIAIFASGAGTNAKKIIEYFDKPGKDQIATIALIVTNKAEAGVLLIAKRSGIPALIIEKEKFFRGDVYIPELQKHQIDLIVLAGFLWKLPTGLVNAYRKKVINIHPALLPNYGGKGMYGTHVHEAVILNKEKQSGITIHFADELYDHGEIISQAFCQVDPSDDANTLAKKIHALEHHHYPRVIEQLVQKQNQR
ncbi:MAG: phosphoribosylglycinamide formyltransferase [Ferruginibacter sp.]